MYNDQAVIQNHFETSLVNRFGTEIKDEIFSLIGKLTGKDTYITNNLWLSLQNMLALTKQEVQSFVNLGLRLAPASAVIPVLLFEKIPTLAFYGLTAEVCQFITNIQNYGTRAVAYYLGCDQLKIDDLLHILEQSTLPFYRKLLSAVNERHEEFAICSSIIMRFSAKMEVVITDADINDYLDICAELVKEYGCDLTEQYIRNAHVILTKIPLNQHLKIIHSLAEKSPDAAEFCLMYPSILFSFLEMPADSVTELHAADAEALKKIKINLLKTNDYHTFLANPSLFNDKDFFSMMMSWPKIIDPIKANILFQLEKDDYKQFILNHPDVAPQRNIVNEVSHSNWLKSWMYCGEIVDLAFLRKKMGVMLQTKENFSLEAKSIVKQNSTLFDRSNTNYDEERIAGMIRVLQTHCVNESVQEELAAMSEFVAGNRQPLKNILSRSTLVVQAWERNPWVDYGRSDELFSCTTLGDYNVGNAPGFLADLSMNKLDVWNNGVRVGRIHLCLTRDTQGKTILLLDCVDGSERILVSKKKFELLMSSVFAYAGTMGIDDIKVNYDVDFNTTPKKFIAHVEATHGGQKQIDFISRYLTESSSRHLIPYPCQTFLESFIKNDGAFVRGAYLLRTEHYQA